MNAKTEELREKINKYLTKQFICDPKELPSNECRNEATHILQTCKGQGLIFPDGVEIDI